MKAKVDSAIFSHTFGGQDGKPPVKVHNVVAGGVAYQSWDADILNKIGQEVEFEVIPAKDPKYPPRMKMGGTGGGYGGGGFKKPFTPSFRDSREGMILSTRGMVLSYTKDVVCSMLQTALLKPENVWIEVMKGYAQMLPLLKLDELKEATPPQQPSGEQHAPQCKNLTTMLHEIKLIPNMQLFGKWWNDNQASIRSLSAGDKQILFAEKAHHTAEIEGQVTSDEIPFN